MTFNENCASQPAHKLPEILAIFVSEPVRLCKSKSQSTSPTCLSQDNLNSQWTVTGMLD